MSRPLDAGLHFGMLDGVPAAWSLAILRLTALLTAVGLATSRIGLVVHELVGHGGATVAVGGTVTEVELFYLAGGWIRFRDAPDTGWLAIAMGGIAVEAVIGLTLVLASLRRETLVARIVRAVGCALIIHASWYLATGTWHGYGDGVRLHRELGELRWIVAVPAAIVACSAAYAGARVVLGPLAHTIPGSRRSRIAGTVIAIVVAGVVQLGGALAEVRLRQDVTYTATMRPERDRIVARELATWSAAERARGARPTEQAREQMEQTLDRRHRTFPFAVVLGGLLVLAIGLGAARSRALPGARVSTRLLATATVLAGGSIALVIALDAAFH